MLTFYCEKKINDPNSWWKWKNLVDFMVCTFAVKVSIDMLETTCVNELVLRYVQCPSTMPMRNLNEYKNIVTFVLIALVLGLPYKYWQIRITYFNF